jgi:uncharacterized membrane protein YidH (DUF202 family)
MSMLELPIPARCTSSPPGRRPARVASIALLPLSELVGVGRGRGGGEGVRTRDHLANVRTLLAFLRTGMVLLGLGLVID